MTKICKKQSTEYNQTNTKSEWLIRPWQRFSVLPLRQQRFQGTNHVIGPRNEDKTAQKEYCCNHKNSRSQRIKFKISNHQTNHALRAETTQYCGALTVATAAALRQQRNKHRSLPASKSNSAECDCIKTLKSSRRDQNGEKASRRARSVSQPTHEHGFLWADQ